ncbi:MAG: SoxR reducing system RseC family protein [Oscillospiraceae bacterium]|nr:SoxR reducing system RseC family protein [Oscillospiraceae bacterium]
MLQTARVTRLLADGRAEISVKRQSACGHDCAKCGGGCAELTVMPTVTVTAENPVRAAVGDSVSVESTTRAVLGAAAVVYLLPLVLFFVGYFIAYALEAGGGVSAAFGVIGFAAGAICAIVFDRRVKKRRGIVFRILQIERDT